MLALWLCAAAAAAEYAVLVTGACIYVERHEFAGNTVRLYRGEGFIELPREAVAGFEPVVRATPSLPAADRRTPSPRRLIEEAAARYGGPDFAALLDAVAQVESGFRVDAVSPKGARGLLQLMPETARWLEADPDDPAQNADAGARYLRELLLRYLDHPQQLRLALAAYNAGPGAVERHGGVPPYPETVRYVERVLAEFRQRLRSASSRAR
ncbi:MAG: lytic transglycosylase domain-containing protein [Bryobacterales bacterium]|nr:lytic transglycosylase domain-containing protein [Bryobacteraceae bacterium]MDW8130251.1 lytic transglycosylase domain-containing protein [Bryobacterales bacterium]